MPRLASITSQSLVGLGLKLPLTVTSVTNNTLFGNNRFTEGETYTFTVNTENANDGDILYFWIVDLDTDIFRDFDTAAGSFTINNNTGTFDVTVANDFYVEDTERFRVQIQSVSTRNQGVIFSTSLYDVINVTPVRVINAVDGSTVVEAFLPQGGVVGSDEFASMALGQEPITVRRDGTGLTYDEPSVSFAQILNTSEWTVDFFIDNAGSGPQATETYLALDSGSGTNQITIGKFLTSNFGGFPRGYLGVRIDGHQTYFVNFQPDSSLNHVSVKWDGGDETLRIIVNDGPSIQLSQPVSRNFIPNISRLVIGGDGTTNSNGITNNFDLAEIRVMETQSLGEPTDESAGDNEPGSRVLLRAKKLYLVDDFRDNNFDSVYTGDSGRVGNYLVVSNGSATITSTPLPFGTYRLEFDIVTNFQTGGDFTGIFPAEVRLSGPSSAIIYNLSPNDYSAGDKVIVPPLDQPGFAQGSLSDTSLTVRFEKDDPELVLDNLFWRQA